MIQHGQNEILTRQKKFERQQRSVQTFGFRNADYSSARDAQGGIITTSGTEIPAATRTVSLDMPDATEIAGQGAVISGSPCSILRAIENEQKSSVDSAVQFLSDILRDASLAAVEIEPEAKAASISWATIRRAQNVLRIKPRKGKGGKFIWELPAN